MAGIGDLFFRVVVDASSLAPQLEKAGAAAGDSGGTAFATGFDAHVQKIAKNAAVALGGIFATTKLVDFFAGAVSKASDLNESISKSTVVFGANAAAISAWSDTAARNLGLSKQAALESSASFGNLFKTMGLSGTATAQMSQDVVKLASDLASFNNIGTDEALDKLRSGLVGEAEPLRALGVQLTEASVKAKAVQLGLASANGEISEGAKVQARFALIMEQTKTAQGDFARTSDGLANSQRINNALWDDAQAKLGEKLLPIMTDLAHFAGDVLVPALGLLADNLNTIVAVAEPLVLLYGTRLVASFAASTLAAVGMGTAVTGVAAAEGTATTATGVLSTALAALPWVLVAAAAVQLINRLSDLGSIIEGINGTQVQRLRDGMHNLESQFGVNENSSGALGDAYRNLKKQYDDLTGSITYATQATIDHGSAIDTVTATAEDNTRRINENAQAHDEAAGITAGYVGVLGEEIGYLGDADDAAAGLAGTEGDLGVKTDQGSAYFRQFTTDAGETGAGLDNVQAAAIAAASGLDTMGASATAAGNDAARAAGQFRSAAAAAAAFNRSANIKGGGVGPGAEGPGIDPSQTGPGSVPGLTTDEYYAETHPYTPYTPKVTHGHHGGGKGGKGKDAAAAALKERQQAVRDWANEEKKALAVAKDANEKYLSFVHDKNLKKIASDRDAAMKAIDASHEQATKYIADRRKEMEADFQKQHEALYAGVNAAEAAIEQRQIQHQLRDAQEADAAAQKELQDALASGDENRIAQATAAARSSGESLQDIQDQQNVTALRAAADAAAAQLDIAQKTAEDGFDAQQTQVDKDYDAAKTAEQNLYDLQVGQENIRYEEQKTAYQRQYDLLVDHLDKLQGEVIDPKLKKATAAFRTHGEDAATAYAAGMLSKAKEVGDAAAALAKVISDYLETHSPAKRGPLHRMSPHEMGFRIGIGTAAGIADAAPFAGVALASLGARLPALAVSGQWSGIGASSSVDQSRTQYFDFTVNNPAPEPASRSADRTLRQVAAGLWG